LRRELRPVSGLTARCLRLRPELLMRIQAAGIWCQFFKPAQHRADPIMFKSSVRWVRHARLRIVCHWRPQSCGSGLETGLHRTYRMRTQNRGYRSWRAVADAGGAWREHRPHRSGRCRRDGTGSQERLAERLACGHGLLSPQSLSLNITERQTRAKPEPSVRSSAML
jgi:hypothetical protein